MKTQNDIAVYTGVYIGLHVTYILIFRLSKIGSKTVLQEMEGVLIRETCAHNAMFMN